MLPVTAKLSPWQAKYCWQDRFKFIKESGKLADCEILIGVEKKAFKCHKQILAMASPVFEEKFYPLCHALDAIAFPEIEPETFDQISNFIYLNEIDTKSFPFHMLGKLLQAAKILKINDFRLACINYLSVCQWPLEHIFSIYNAALFHNEHILVSLANQHIVSNKDQLLKHSTLFTQSFQRFVDILGYFARPCSEMLLFRTIEKYCIQNKLCESNDEEDDAADGDKEIKEKGKTEEGSTTEKPKAQGSNQFGLVGTSENLRDKTKELCKIINFSNMTPTEFAEGPAISKLLDREECFEILLKICKEHKCKENVFNFSSQAKLLNVLQK